MKEKIKKLTAICLVLFVVLSSLIWSKATEAEITPSKDLLEVLLGERSWVLDTIVDGDYTTNPCEYIANTPKFETYSEALYGRFVDDPVNALLVRLTDIIYNSGQYLADALSSLALHDLQSLAFFYNIIIPDEYMSDVDYIITCLTNTMASLHKVKEEKYYEYIMNGVFTTEYNSPAQISLEEQEANLSELQTLKDHLKGVQNIIDEYKDLVDLGQTEVDVNKYIFIENLRDNYEYSVGTFLDSYSVVGNTKGYTQEMLDYNRDKFSDSLFTMTMIQKTDIDEDETLKQWKGMLYADNFLTKTNKVLEVAGTAVNFASTAVNNYLLIESLQTQKESTLSALDSLYNKTENRNLKNSVATYRNLINDEFDGLTFLYKTGIDMVTENNLIFDSAAKFITKTASKLVIEHMNTSVAKIVSKPAATLALIHFATNLIDFTTGVEETAKKVYQIEHALKMIEEMKIAFEDSLSKYKKDKTEEKAKQVLSNLMFLQKIRMFTCKLAHDSAVNQLESPLGKKLTGTDSVMLVEGWDALYQEQIDAILSATVNPISKKPLNLDEGDSITIFADENYAICKIDGRFYYVGEISERMMGGIVINGANINVVNSSEETVSFFITNITATGDCKIKIQDNVELITYAFSHESGTITLDVNGNLTVRKCLDAETTVVDDGGLGNIKFKGEVKLVDCTIPSATFIGDSTQYVHGSNAYIGKLVLDNLSRKGIVITGNINVTDLFSNAGTKVIGGRNLLLKSTGSIAGDYVHGDLAVENFNYNRNIVFGDGLYVVGSMNITADHAEIKGEFSSVGDAIVNSSSNSYVNICGDTYFKSATLNFDGLFECDGDINIDSGQSVCFKNLILNGASPQCIKTTIPVLVENFVNKNSSSNGVTVSGDWQISNSIESASSKINNGTNLILLGGSKITDGKLNSGISVSDWNCDYDLDIKGSLNTMGTTSFGSSIKIDVGGSFCVADNTTIYDDVSINIKEDLSSKGDFSVGNNVALKIGGNMKQDEKTIVAGENTGFDINGNFIQKKGSFILSEKTSFDVGSDFSSADSVLISDGILNIKGDASFTNTALEANGESIFHRDFYATSFTAFFEHLKFESLIPQSYYCDSALSVNNLTLTNLSVGGITIGNTVNVAETFKNNSLRVVNRENVVCKTYVMESENGVTVVEGNFYLSQWDGENDLYVTETVLVNKDVVIPAGKTVTVDGDLQIINGNLTVENGASLIIKTNFTGTEGNVLLEGCITVSDDISLNNIAIVGNGELVISGDLYAGDSVVNCPNAVFRSKVPQVISGSQISFNNIVFENTSSSGVKAMETVNYCGELINESNLTSFNSEKFIKKEEA